MNNLEQENKKDIAEIKILATIPKTGENLTFYALTTRKIINAISEEKIKDKLQNYLKEVNTEKAAVIKSMDVHFEFEASEHEIFQPIGKTNILVEVNLPYCLHLPNGYSYDMRLGDGEIVYIRLKKIWTENTTNPNNPEDLEPSSENDIFADRKELFLNNIQILSPIIPQREKAGWHYRFRGKNVEKVSDSEGYFRYTKMFIYIASHYTKDDIKKNNDKIKLAIKEKTGMVVNGLIEIYRYITKEEYVERLSEINIMNIYFLEFQEAIATISLAQNYIRSASINKSKEEIDNIKIMLALGDMPSLYETLLLNAKNSFRKGDFATCVVETFQSLEIFLENFLIANYGKLGLSKNEIEKRMREFWDTKERLKYLIKELTGKDLLLDNNLLWQDFCHIYDKVRNEVIHRGLFPSKADTKKTMDTNENIIKYIKSLRVRVAISAKYKKQINQKRVLSFKIFKTTFKIFRDI